jgi:hypothetical protein
MIEQCLTCNEMLKNKIRLILDCFVKPKSYSARKYEE